MCLWLCWCVFFCGFGFVCLWGGGFFVYIVVVGSQGGGGLGAGFRGTVFVVFFWFFFGNGVIGFLVFVGFM